MTPCHSHRVICLVWYNQYAISQLQNVRSGMHLVTHVDVGNFCNKSTKTTLHEICVQDFLRFSDSSKPRQSLSLLYELAWFAGISKSEKNLLNSSCKVAPVTKVAHILWWPHNNRKQSASADERWCDISCDIPYSSGDHSHKGGSTNFQKFQRNCWIHPEKHLR